MRKRTSERTNGVTGRDYSLRLRKSTHCVRTYARTEKCAGLARAHLHRMHVRERGACRTSPACATRRRVVGYLIRSARSAVARATTTTTVAHTRVTQSVRTARRSYLSSIASLFTHPRAGIGFSVAIKKRGREREKGGCEERSYQRRSDQTLKKEGKCVCACSCLRINMRKKKPRVVSPPTTEIITNDETRRY